MAREGLPLLLFLKTENGKQLIFPEYMHSFRNSPYLTKALTLKAAQNCP